MSEVWTEEDRKQLWKMFPSILSSGLNIVADRQMGKTNLAKVLVAELATQNVLPVKLKVFDTAQVWRHSFSSSFKFQEINDQTRQVYECDKILYDIEFDDSEEIMQFVGNTVLLDYEKSRLMKKVSGGILPYWTIYTLEESQNSLGRFALSRNSGKIWLKMVSEGANFNLAFLFIGQRAADISSQVVERQQSYLIGKTCGDNNSRKLSRLVGRTSGMTQLGQPIHEVAKTLNRGEFIWWSGSEAWRFNCPRFEDVYPDQKPVEVKPPVSRWEKIF